MRDTQAILKEVEALVAGRATRANWLQEVCALLASARSHYNWVGVYFLEGNELVLGPYVGAVSPHMRIPLDKGICGAAAREKKTVIVHDVSADPRYLACSVETKSEMVVPIEFEGRLLGEIDIDSHFPNAFQANEQVLLEQVAQRLAPVLAPTKSGQAREAVGRG